jgi:hypothetical protein
MKKPPDPVWFCKTVLMGREAEQLMAPAFGKVLAEMIGGGNKLVLMDGGGNVSIVNESAGVWDGSCWFSNDCYRSAYSACKAGYRGLSFGDLPLWEQAITQGDVWRGWTPTCWRKKNGRLSPMRRPGGRRGRQSPVT